MKNDKAPRIDNMPFEQIKNSGSTARKWVLNLYNDCVANFTMPTLWRQSRIIAILKPGKGLSLPKSYRPIVLLCHLYKLYERMIHDKIAPTIERHLIAC